MLLKDLYDLAGRLERDPTKQLPTIGYEDKPVALQFHLRRNGTCKQIVDTRTPDNRLRGESVFVPNRKRSGTKPLPCLAVDNLAYVAALQPDGTVGTDDERHRWYLDLLDEAIIAAPAASADLKAIRTFSEDPQVVVGALSANGVTELAPGTLATFFVSGRHVVDHSDVQTFWAATLSGELAGDDGVCQITGRLGPLARKTPALRHLPGNQPTLSSANFDAAEHYGLTQTQSARLSVDAALRSTAALNWLLSHDRHHHRVGNLTFLWWCPDDLDFDPLGNVLNPDPGAVKALLAKSIWSGHPHLIDTSPFRCVTLDSDSGNARVSVRSDHTTTLNAVDDNLRHWFQRTELPGKGGTTYWPRIARLAESVARPSKAGPDIGTQKRLIADLVAHALVGRPLPRSHLGAVIGRCRAERNVTNERAALLQLLVTTQEDHMDDDSPPKLCGALFAELESLQRTAIPNLNRTIADKYYASVSTTPRAVLPGLLRHSEAHLSKLRRDRPAAHFAISQRIAQVMSDLNDSGGIPALLNLSAQADFALGYWTRRHEQFEAIHQHQLDHPQEENA